MTAIPTERETTALARFLGKLRGLNLVLRWNFTPRNRQENVAEHSFWVAMYAMAIAYEAGYTEKMVQELTIRGLLHDAEESITADLPALVKRHTDWGPVKDKALVELFPRGNHTTKIKEEHLAAERCDIVKSADLISAMVYAREELRTGNTYFDPILMELVGSLNSVIKRNAERPAMAKAVEKLAKDLVFDLQMSRPRPDDMSHF